MKAGWRDAPLALRDSVVSNIHDTWKMSNIISVMKRSKIFSKRLQTTKSFANIFQGLSKTLI